MLTQLMPFLPRRLTTRWSRGKVGDCDRHQLVQPADRHLRHGDHGEAHPDEGRFS